MAEPGLCHFHIPELAFVARQIVVEHRFLGMPLHGLQQDHLGGIDGFSPTCGVGRVGFVAELEGSPVLWLARPAGGICGARWAAT